MQSTRTEQGFSVVEALLVLVVLAILGFTCWFVWHSKQSADKSLQSSTPYTNPVQAQNYLVIKEWGIKLEVTDPALKDAVYTLDTPQPNSGIESVTLATKNTKQLQLNCEGEGGATSTTTAGGGNHLYRAKQSADLENVSQRPPADFRQVGGYWYIYDRNMGYGNCHIADAAIAAQAEAAANSYMKVTILPN